MDWLFDLGNTRVKWACARDGRLCGPVRALVYAEADDWIDALTEASAETAEPPQRLYLAAVAAETEVGRLAAALRRRWPAIPLRRIQTPAAGAGVRVAYAEPARLGVDRYLAMVAARAHVAGPCLVIGAGTALTLDLLDADGLHHGGLIAPSPRLMIAAIEQRTARVRIDREPARVEFATDTAAALHSGAWNAALALIERTRDRAGVRLDGRVPELLLHGGDAAALGAALPAARHVPTLVLEGLARYAHDPS